MNYADTKHSGNPEVKFLKHKKLSSLLCKESYWHGIKKNRIILGPLHVQTKTQYAEPGLLGFVTVLWITATTASPSWSNMQRGFYFGSTSLSYAKGIKIYCEFSSAGTEKLSNESLKLRGWRPSPQKRWGLKGKQAQDCG